jgi:hypothetical protein
MALRLPAALLSLLTLLVSALLPGPARGQVAQLEGLVALNRLEESLAGGQPYTAMDSETLAGFYFRAGNYVLAEPLTNACWMLTPNVSVSSRTSRPPR